MRNNLTSEYDDIIREQLESDVIEPAPTTAQGTEFYIPHKAVVRETAATTKMRIVYDAPAKVNPDAPSLNDCLSGGIAKAFLLVKVYRFTRALFGLTSFSLHSRGSPRSALGNLGHAVPGGVRSTTPKFVRR